MDEVYMLTVFDKKAEHYSVLRLKASEIPDPERTHFIYSFSKVSCIQGFDPTRPKTISASLNLASWIVGPKPSQRNVFHALRCTSLEKMQTFPGIWSKNVSKNVRKRQQYPSK